MAEPNPNLDEAIERLRRRLHEALGQGYDPDKFQEAREISSQLDALIVEATRERSLKREKS